MTFLIKIAFWLMVLVLLLPTEEGARSEVYGTAQAAFNDVVTFCDRNPETCAKGKDAFGVFMQKAQFGARMLMDVINGPSGPGEGQIEGPIEAPIEAPADAEGAETDGAFEPARFDLGAPQDTLSAEDRAEAWGGPDGSGT